MELLSGALSIMHDLYVCSRGPQQNLYYLHPNACSMLLIINKLSQLYFTTQSSRGTSSRSRSNRGF